MAKILMIAQGEYIAEYGRRLRNQLGNPDALEIAVAHMEDAVAAAKERLDGGVEVIIARATTAALLREANLPVSVVAIPITNEEIFDSVTKARALAKTGTPIGFLGFKTEVSSLTAILGAVGFRINLYDVQSTRQNHAQLAQAKKDGVSVLVCGELSAARVRRAGMKAVVIKAAFDSIRHAYEQAEYIVQALAAERKKTQEAMTIFESVSDAVVCLDADGRATMINQPARHILHPKMDESGIIDGGSLFSPREIGLVSQARQTGEEQVGGIVERQGVQYAMRAVPTMVGGLAEGVVVTLQEIRALQRMEATVRKGLYQKGNVAHYVFDDIKGDSDAMRDAVRIARTFAGLQSNVLVVGETGTGKELFAQSIHNAGARKDRPFVAVNCGAIPANLIESELFGYEDGAFTGSKKGGKMGLFELAHSGTIFLDEISEMDPIGQVNLLRALQEHQIRRVGGGSVIPIDVRVIAACNANLGEMVRAGRFRRDLYYRLSVLVLRIPPLRHRQTDVAPLAGHFIGQYNRRFGKNISLSASAVQELEAFPWDGNIRQLRNFCERLTAVAEDPLVDAACVRHNLVDALWDNDPSPAFCREQIDRDGETAEKNETTMLRGILYSKSDMLELLGRHRGNREAVASHLGVSRTTLWKHLKRLRICGPDS